MTMKRSRSSNVVNNSKRQKQKQSNLVDKFINENLRECRECQGDLLEDCINFDFSPKVYFSLALILEDSSRRILLKDQEDPTVSQLRDYAIRLSYDNNLVLNTLSKLSALCSSFTKESVKELSSKLSNRSIHQQRELKFIGSCLGSMKSSTIDMIQSQSANKEISLDYIVFSDIRLARLLPLLSFIYDDEPQVRPVDLTVSDDDGSFLSSAFILKQNSDMDVFELDEDGNLMDSLITQESLDPFILPAPSEITLTDDNTEAESNGNDFASIRFQSPDVSLQSFPNSQELSIPDYDVYTTAELKSKLKQYGFKTCNNRTTMIKDLQKIYTSIHNNNSSSQTSVISQKRVIHSDTESGANSPAPLTSSQSADADLKKKIINHIKSKPNLMEKILNYESVSIDECNDGLNCKKSVVKTVLDEFGATSQFVNKKFKVSD